MDQSVILLCCKLSWPSELTHDTLCPVGHMPFGKVDAMRDQSNYANQIFQRYHRTIAAHFYGHRYASQKYHCRTTETDASEYNRISHVDEFEIAYPDYNDRRAETANGIAYISGALTPASKFAGLVRSKPLKLTTRLHLRCRW